jgi:hypothetical protein
MSEKLVRLKSPGVKGEIVAEKEAYELMKRLQGKALPEASRLPSLATVLAENFEHFEFDKENWVWRLKRL